MRSCESALIGSLRSGTSSTKVFGVTNDHFDDVGTQLPFGGAAR
jgi:hypothetical protein